VAVDTAGGTCGGDVSARGAEAPWLVWRGRTRRNDGLSDSWGGAALGSGLPGDFGRVFWAADAGGGRCDSICGGKSWGDHARRNLHGARGDGLLHELEWAAGGRRL